MSKVLFEEDYVENGHEYRRKVTCCMAFLRRQARLHEVESATERLWQVMRPEMHGHLRIMIDPVFDGASPFIYCPHCGDKLKEKE